MAVVETEGSYEGRDAKFTSPIIDVESHTAPTPIVVPEGDPVKLADPENHPFFTSETPSVNGNGTNGNGSRLNGERPPVVSGPVVITGAERAVDAVAREAAKKVVEDGRGAKVVLGKPDGAGETGPKESSTDFTPGQRINVRRTAGEVESDWAFVGIAPDTGNALVLKRDPDRDGTIRKEVPLDELRDLNPQQTENPSPQEEVVSSSPQPAAVEGAPAEVQPVPEPIYRMVDGVPTSVEPQPAAELPNPGEGPLPALTPQQQVDRVLAEATGDDELYFIANNKSMDTRDSAHDAADRRLNQPKDKVGFFKRAWNGYVRIFQKEKLVQQEIALRSEHGDYGTDEHAHEVQASVDARSIRRLALKNIDTEAGEMRVELGNDPASQAVASELRGLIRHYVSGDMDPNAFQEERKRVLAELTKQYPDLMGGDKALRFADNMEALAEAIRSRADTEEAQLRMVDNVHIILGRTRDLQRTETHYTAAERIYDKVEKLPGVGKLLANEGAVTLGIAAALTAGNVVGGRLASAARLGIIGFGTSLLAGMREGKQFTDKRTQHLRDRAVGELTGPDSPQRTELDSTVYEMVSADQMTTIINESMLSNETNPDGKRLYKTTYSEAELRTLMTAVAGARARYEMSSRDKRDLISYSSLEDLPKERDELVRAIAAGQHVISLQLEANPDLAAALNPTGNLQEMMTTAMEATRGDLLNDVESKNEVFTRLRRKAVAKRMAIAGLTGVVVGGAFQEIRAHFEGGIQGIGEHSSGTGTEHHTALRSLVDSITHHGAEHHGPGAALNVDDTHKLIGGGGAEWVHHSDGTYSLVEGGHHIADGLHLKDGVLTQSSADKLHKAGVLFGTHKYSVEAPGSKTPVDAKDFLNAHKSDVRQVSRSWMNNDTPASFDKNELRMHLYMGEDGHYKYDMRSMFEGGSYRGATAEHIQELVNGDKASVLFSLSEHTQGTPIELTMHNGVLDIDPNGPYGQLIHMVGGRPRLNVLHAEVAHRVGEANGKSIYNILATDTGPGKTSFLNPRIDHHVDTIIRGVPPRDVIVDAPDFIPIPSYTPLEPTVRPEPENPTIVETPPGPPELEPGPQPIAAIGPGEPEGPRELEPGPRPFGELPVGSGEVVGVIPREEWERQQREGVPEVTGYPLSAQEVRYLAAQIKKGKLTEARDAIGTMGLWHRDGTDLVPNNRSVGDMYLAYLQSILPDEEIMPASSTTVRGELTSGSGDEETNTPEAPENPTEPEGPSESQSAETPVGPEEKVEKDSSKDRLDWLNEARAAMRQLESINPRIADAVGLSFQMGVTKVAKRANEEPGVRNGVMYVQDDYVKKAIEAQIQLRDVDLNTVKLSTLKGLAKKIEKLIADLGEQGGAEIPAEKTAEAEVTSASDTEQEKTPEPVKGPNAGRKLSPEEEEQFTNPVLFNEPYLNDLFRAAAEERRTNRAQATEAQRSDNPAQQRFSELAGKVSELARDHEDFRAAAAYLGRADKVVVSARAKRPLIRDGNLVIPKGLGGVKVMRDFIEARKAIQSA